MSYQELSIFFFEELHSINEKRGLKLTDNCVGYMSELLISGVQKEFLFKDNQKKYLFDLYQKTLEPVGERERFAHYKHLGDYSLIVSGYFTESINDVVGVEYYIDMGSLAYEQAATSLYRDPYYELASKYPVCVSALNEFSVINKKESYSDIIKLYNFWSVTKSQYTKEKLLKLGLLTEAIDE